jgi:hypothetical protein
MTRRKWLRIRLLTIFPVCGDELILSQTHYSVALLSYASICARCSVPEKSM